MSRFTKVALTTMVMVLISMVFVPISMAIELPDELVRFLPGSPDVLIVVPSLNEAERAWAEAREMIMEVTDEPGEDIPSIRDILLKMNPEAPNMLMWDKPIALAISVPNIMMGGQPQFALVAPVNHEDYDFQTLSEPFEMPVLQFDGDYALFSENPEYVQATAPSPLLDRLPEGPVAMCANMQTLWSQLSPMLDFGLMAMNAPKAPVEGEDTPPAPEMSPEQVAAMGDMIRTAMDSADMLTLAVDIRDNYLHFTEEFVTLPGSALDPREQPDFQTALELTKLVDPKADWVGAYALDVDNLINLYKDFYLLSLQQDLAKMNTDLDLDLVGVMEDYFKTMDQFMVPGAFAMNINGDELDISYVLATDDAQGIIDQQMESLEKYGELIPFLINHDIDESKINGHKVVGWDFQWDADAMRTMMSNQMGDKAQDEDAQQVMTAVMGFYQKFMPGMRMMATDEHFFMVMGRDTDPLKDMSKLAERNKGKVQKDLAKTAKMAGRHCQAVFKGDLAPLMVLAFEMVEEFSDEDFPALDLDPMPLSYTVRVDDLAYGVDYKMGLKGLPRFIEAMESLDDD